MLTVRARPGSLTDTAARLVTAAGIPSALVDAMPPPRAAALAGLGDADFESAFVVPLADLAQTLADLLPLHRRIVLVGSTAGLGDWDAVLSGAFAAGATGLMRSVALEFMSHGVTINLIAAPSDDPCHALQVAALASALLASDGVSGQAVPCDGGANLRMSRARPRAAPLREP